MKSILLTWKKSTHAAWLVAATALANPPTPSQSPAQARPCPPFPPGLHRGTLGSEAPRVPAQAHPHSPSAEPQTLLNRSGAALAATTDAPEPLALPPRQATPAPGLPESPDGSSPGAHRQSRLPLRHLFHQWALEHLASPYPDPETLAAWVALGREHGLTTESIRNWFINFRMRDWRGLCKEHGVHPKEKDPKRPLQISEQGRELLFAWLEDHWDHPYPTSQQMLQLAKATGLSDRQIKNWFNNHRKRRWPKQDEPPFVPRSAPRQALEAYPAASPAGPRPPVAARPWPQAEALAQGPFLTLRNQTGHDLWVHLDATAPPMVMRRPGTRHAAWMPISFKPRKLSRHQKLQLAPAGNALEVQVGFTLNPMTGSAQPATFRWTRQDANVGEHGTYGTPLCSLVWVNALGRAARNRMPSQFQVDDHGLTLSIHTEAGAPAGLETSVRAADGSPEDSSPDSPKHSSPDGAKHSSQDGPEASKPSHLPNGWPPTDGRRVLEPSEGQEVGRQGDDRLGARALPPRHRPCPGPAMAGGTAPGPQDPPLEGPAPKRPRLEPRMTGKLVNASGQTWRLVLEDHYGCFKIRSEGDLGPFEVPPLRDLDMALPPGSTLTFTPVPGGGPSPARELNFRLDRGAEYACGIRLALALDPTNAEEAVFFQPLEAPFGPGSLLSIAGSTLTIADPPRPSPGAAGQEAVEPGPLGLPDPPHLGREREAETLDRQARLRGGPMLRAWALTHLYRPYPDDATVQHWTAQIEGLTPDQVHNWFVNFRKREWDEALLRHGVTLLEHDPRRPRPLNLRGLDLLQTWAEGHPNQVPTWEEAARLADQGGLLAEQVLDWCRRLPRAQASAVTPPLVGSCSGSASPPEPLSAMPSAFPSPQFELADGPDLGQGFLLLPPANPQVTHLLPPPSPRSILSAPTHAPHEALAAPGLAGSTGNLPKPPSSCPGPPEPAEPSAGERVAMDLEPPVAQPAPAPGAPAYPPFPPGIRLRNAGPAPLTPPGLARRPQGPKEQPPAPSPARRLLMPLRSGPSSLEVPLTLFNESGASWRLTFEDLNGDTIRYRLAKAPWLAPGDHIMESGVTEILDPGAVWSFTFLAPPDRPLPLRVKVEQLNALLPDRFALTPVWTGPPATYPGTQGEVWRFTRDCIYAPRNHPRHFEDGGHTLHLREGADRAQFPLAPPLEPSRPRDERGPGVLRAWLEGQGDTHPTRDQMEVLAEASGLSQEEVSIWFTNVRRRRRQAQASLAPAGWPLPAPSWAVAAPPATRPAQPKLQEEAAPGRTPAPQGEDPGLPLTIRNRTGHDYWLQASPGAPPLALQRPGLDSGQWRPVERNGRKIYRNQKVLLAHGGTLGQAPLCFTLKARDRSAPAEAFLWLWPHGLGQQDGAPPTPSSPLVWVDAKDRALRAGLPSGFRFDEARMTLDLHAVADAPASTQPPPGREAPAAGQRSAYRLPGEEMLRAWVMDHLYRPYPDGATVRQWTTRVKGLTPEQCETWLINFRQREWDEVRLLHGVTLLEHLATRPRPLNQKGLDLLQAWVERHPGRGPSPLEASRLAEQGGLMVAQVLDWCQRNSGSPAQQGRANRSPADRRRADRGPADRDRADRGPAAPAPPAEGPARKRPRLEPELAGVLINQTGHPWRVIRVNLREEILLKYEDEGGTVEAAASMTPEQVIEPGAALTFTPVLATDSCSSPSMDFVLDDGAGTSEAIRLVRVPHWEAGAQVCFQPVGAPLRPGSPLAISGSTLVITGHPRPAEGALTELEARVLEAAGQASQAPAG